MIYLLVHVINFLVYMVYHIIVLVDFFVHMVDLTL